MRPMLPFALAAGLLLPSLPLRAEPLWVEVALPARVEGPLPWLELSGQAGRRDERRHDVVIAIDVSGSTGVASGTDVDGDGRLGRRLRSADDPLRRPNPNRLSTDDGDTVLQAQIEATRRLLERLAAPGTRVGLLAFASAPRTLAPLGSAPEALEAALQELAEKARPGGGTNLGRAIDAGLAMLAQASAATGGAPPATPATTGDARPPRRSLVLLTDGSPSEPAPLTHAEAATSAAGSRLAAADVRLRAFALGPEALAESDVLARVAGATGGTLQRLASAGEVVDALPRLRLAGVGDVRIDNVTLGASARAVRLFADGSFDGVVPLAPGVNDVRVTAYGRDAEPRTVARRVVFAPREAADAAEARAAERWLERLRLRTVETELAVEARRPPGARDLQRRDLEIGGEPPGAPQPSE